MPRPASEIRARGDRIRRRRHAVIAGVSAAVVAAVAVPVIALSAGDESKEIPPADPSVSDPVRSLGVTDANLITEEEAYWYDAGTEWEEGATLPGDGQAPPNPCLQSSFAGLGATSVRQREFEWKAREPGSDDSWPFLNELIGEFGSPAAARAAHDEIQGWFDQCRPPGSDGLSGARFTPVDVPVEGEGSVVTATYGPVDEELDPFGEERWFLDTGLVLAGDRVALITALSHGQDYNFEVTPAARMVPAAAARLVLGEPGGPTDSPSPTDEWVTAVPDGFPLTSGWPEDDGSSEYQLDAPSEDNRAMVPAGELTACGDAVVDPGAVDRITARLSYGSAAYVRELALLPTDQEAITYLAHVRAVYGDCPTEGTAPAITTAVAEGAIGEESVVVTRVGEEIYRTVINAIRVGNAVVVDLASDEGSAADIGSLATKTRENLADVVAAMNDLQGGDTSPSTDPTGPAGTTSVPADFPLDLVLDGAPPSGDSDTTVEGPSVDAQGVGPQTICGVGGALPDYASRPKGTDDLNYSVSTIEGYQGRTLRAFPTVRQAVDTMELLRTQVTACDRDSTETSLTDRLWRTFESDTGYDSVTFGYTYEVKSGVGAPAGQLYTAVRVGNAILALEWSGEYSAAYQAAAAPDQVELARAIAAEMCVFAEAGC